MSGLRRWLLSSKGPCASFKLGLMLWAGRGGLQDVRCDASHRFSRWCPSRPVDECDSWFLHIMDWSEISGDAHFISGFQLCGLHVTASAVSVYHALTADTGLLGLFSTLSFVFY